MGRPRPWASSRSIRRVAEGHRRAHHRPAYLRAPSAPWSHREKRPTKPAAAPPTTFPWASKSEVEWRVVPFKEEIPFNYHTLERRPIRVVQHGELLNDHFACNYVPDCLCIPGRFFLCGSYWMVLQAGKWLPFEGRFGGFRPLGSVGTDVGRVGLPSRQRHRASGGRGRSEQCRRRC